MAKGVLYCMTTVVSGLITVLCSNSTITDWRLLCILFTLVSKMYCNSTQLNRSLSRSFLILKDILEYNRLSKMLVLSGHQAISCMC